VGWDDKNGITFVPSCVKMDQLFQKLKWSRHRHTAWLSQKLAFIVPKHLETSECAKKLHRTTFKTQRLINKTFHELSLSVIYKQQRFQCLWAMTHTNFWSAAW